MAATSAVASGWPAQPRSRPRTRAWPAHELGREVGDRGLVGLDRVEAGERDRRTVGIAPSRSSARCSAAVGGPPSLWSSARAAGDGERARVDVRAAGRPRPPASCTSASSSEGSRPTSLAAAASSAGSSSSPPSIVRTRRRRRSGPSASGALRRAATTARHAGSEEKVRAYGAGSIGMPYCAAGRRALRELLRLAGLERQDDHARAPPQLVAVVPASRSRAGSAENANGQAGSVNSVISSDTVAQPTR